MALPDGKPIVDEDEADAADGLQPLDLNAVASVQPDDDIEVSIEEDAPAAPVAADQAEAPDESETPAADTGEDPADTEYKGFTPAIQKRIQREIRIRRTAEAAANAAVGQRAEFEARATQRETEAENLRVNNLELQRNYAEVLIHAFSKEMDVKQRDLKAARDGADFEVEQKIQGEIDDLRFKQNQVKDMHSRIPAAPERKAASVQAVEATSTPTPARRPTPPTNPIAAQWMTKNASWFNHDKFKTQRRYALVVDAELASEGYDQKSSDYYQELDQRIDAAFPTLRRKKNTVDAPTAGASAPSAGRSNSSKVVLRQSDLATMRQFGLDPTNKMHLKEFARQMKDNSGA